MWLDGSVGVANNVLFAFLEPRATGLVRERDPVASDTVAILRIEAGRNGFDRRLSDLAGGLSTRSDEFRTPAGKAPTSGSRRPGRS